MLRKWIIGFIICLSGSWSYSQNCDSTQWAKPGSYEVEIDTNTFEADITPEIFLTGEDLCFIESQRKSTQAVQIHLRIYLITIYPAKKFADNTTEE